MSNPVLSSNTYGNPFLYYTCDRDPTSSEPLVYNNISDLLIFWWNTTSKNLFWCTDNTASSMVWRNYVDSGNISSIISSMGLTPSVARNRTQRNSPAFSTSYRPSTTSDTEVNLTLNINALLAFSSTVNIQTSPDNTNWTTIFSVVRNLAIAANLNDGYTFTVPVGSYYRVVQASGSVSSIVSIYELAA